MTNLKLHIGDMIADTPLQVIDFRTSYNLLLGRPWLHSNGVVPSTLHQCFKYWENGEQKTVYADESPFTEEEASFADAKFYLTTRPIVKLSPWSNQAVNAKGTPTQVASSQQPAQLKQSSQPAKPQTPTQVASPTQTTMQVVSPKQPTHNNQLAHGHKSAKATPAPKRPNVPILRYIPQSQRKKGEAPLVACNKIQPTPLPKKVTLPLPKLEKRSVVKQLPSQQQLPATRSNEGFDPNAYRLMARVGGNLTKDEIHAKPPVTLPVFTPEQEKLKNEGHCISQGRLGLGYEKPKPVKIYTAQAKPVKTTRKSSADVHQVSVGQISTEKQNISKPVVIRTKAAINQSRLKRDDGPVIIYTLKAAIARARAYDSVTMHHISVTDDEQEEEEFVLKEAPAEFKEGGQSTVDELMKVDLGTAEDPRPTFLSASLTTDEEVEYMALLREYRDIFAWNYTEMPGLDPRVAVHKLAVHPSVRPVKQSQRRFRPELVPEIEEVDKLIVANFIREMKYPSWIANIVPVKNKTGQIRVCVDFRNLNKVCPKDDFPLPITELMVDATKGHEALSFMDGSSGYNQIRMDPKDEELTAFRTPKEIFCYKVMPFGLKKAGATYKRAMQNIFDDFLHKRVECYVDDLVVKTKQRANHLLDLRAVFERLRRFQLKMNPLKCTFGVTSGKFLGFLVHHRGIKIDQSKIDAIQKMPEPRNVSELKSFQGHLAYIRRFISNLAGRCQPFSRLLKKGTPFEWDDSCRHAFNNIKAYLTKPPVLVAPIVDKPLLMYIAAQEKSVGALLAQCDEDNKEHSLYYLSRTLVGAELNYTPIEKTCLALVFAVQKLRHYLLAHSTKLISRADPLKYIMLRPILSSRLAKWALLLSKFEIDFVPQRAIKGQALANFLADHPIPTEWEISEEFPDEEIFLVEILPPWEMYFDGAARRSGAGAGVLFISPNKDLLPYSFVLTQTCSNNEAEYQAILLGLGMAVEMKLQQLHIYDDSALVFKQLSGEFEVKKLEVEPLWRYAGELLAQIPEVSLHHVPRSENGPADALAGIAASLAHLDERPNQVPVCEQWVIPPPAEEETKELTEEIEESLPISASQSETRDWREPIPSMIRDAIEMARTCKQCQIHTDYIHQVPEPLHPTVASWPFEAWGMDIISPISPKSDSDRQYILAATDYFSKWAEAAAYREVKATTVIDFIRTQIIYRYGVPRYIIMDNCTPFKNKVMDRFCKKFRIQQRTSTAYNPAANGLVEAFNKMLCKILKKTIGADKRSWDEKLGEALWAYRTSFRTPTQSTPYSLVYGTEAVLPLKVQLPSLRIAVREGLTTEECAQMRLAELESLNEQRLEAQQRLECYQSRMTRAFNKKVRLRSFQKGDLVFAVRRPMLFTSKNRGQIRTQMGRSLCHTRSLHQRRIQTRHR
ncbi:hypothetical protein H6P81_002823 [Aristolochia fimbriata]|uniref:Uncharacterized protein n=1 Tax=Aristolochia fimbriata TaxID=158543 RepID=A0AAV7FAU3_ARIFI|nr:hypothetical protein H6P81_002823 [Aristolochia fimbriata]